MRWKAIISCEIIGDVVRKRDQNGYFIHNSKVNNGYSGYHRLIQAFQMIYPQ